MFHAEDDAVKHLSKHPPEIALATARSVEQQLSVERSSSLIIWSASALRHYLICLKSHSEIGQRALTDGCRSL
jgi:hypothetical protein